MFPTTLLIFEGQGASLIQAFVLSKVPTRDLTIVAKFKTTLVCLSSQPSFHCHAKLRDQSFLFVWAGLKIPTILSCQTEMP